MAAAGEVAVHDLDTGVAVELGVLETLGGVELAVGGRGGVEDLGERSGHVVVVVEDLVVVAAAAAMAADEYGAGYICFI